MKYLMLIRSKEHYRSQPIPQGLLDAMSEFVAEGFERGVLKETAGLTTSADGLLIRSRDGTLTMTDGPFAETKEVIGGYAMVEVGSKEEAVEIARQFMELHRVHWPEFDAESEIRLLSDY